MVDVVCVNWGSKYPIEYTQRLYNMVRRNTSRDFKFYCLTDCVSNYSGNIHPIELKSGLTGWWNKMQLFRTDVLKQGEYIYLHRTSISGVISIIISSDGMKYRRCAIFSATKMS